MNACKEEAERAASMQQQIDAHRSEIERLKGAHKQELDDLTQRHRAELQEIKKSLQEEVKHATKADQQRVKAEANSQALLEHLQGAQQQITHLEDAIQQEKNSAAQRAHELQTQISHSQSEIDRYRESMGALDQQLEGCKQEMAKQARAHMNNEDTLECQLRDAHEQIRAAFLRIAELEQQRMSPLLMHTCIITHTPQ